MDYRFELLDRSAQPALAIRTRTPAQRLPQVVGQAYGAVMQVASQLGVQPSGAPFVAYYNMGMEDLRCAPLRIPSSMVHRLGWFMYLKSRQGVDSASFHAAR